MLSIPTKQTDRLEFVKPVSSYISNCFGAAAAKEHVRSLELVEKLREDLRTANPRSEQTKELAIRYAAMMRSLDMRVPISEKEARVQFWWYDSFPKGKRYGRYSVPYEIACVLFNVGSSASLLAASHDRTTSDGLKQACAYFQSAAGAFDACLRHLELHPADAVSPDMSAETLKTFTTLMLAQAQECFYEKASADNMKASIIAKLAAAAAELYDTTAAATQTGSLKGLVDKAWTSAVIARGAYYRAVAYYRHSLGVTDAGNYGEAVGWLSEAVKAVKEADKKAKSAGAELQAQVEALSTIVTAACKSATKDNDTIYHQAVPANLTYALIERKSMVKPTPLPEIKAADDPFHRLVPFAVHQAANTYEEKKKEVLRGITKEFDDANDSVRSQLALMNLPGAIQALEASSTGLPTAIKAQVAVVRKEGGVTLIKELFDTLNKLAQQDVTVLNEAVRVLDKEETEDTQMRATYADRWARTPSHNLTSGMRQEAAKFKSNLEHAQKSDAYIVKKFQAIQEFLERAAASDADVIAMLPPGVTQLNKRIEPVIAELQQLLQKLDQVVLQRVNTLNEIRDAMKADDIKQRLVATASNVTYESVYGEELKKYAAPHATLKAGIDEQAQLLTSITAQNQLFVAGKQNDESSRLREEAFQKIDQSLRTYNELKANLREGIGFYTGFQELLMNFKRKCEDFAFARQTEKNDIIGSFSAASAYGGAIAGSGSAIASTSASPSPQIPSMYGSFSASPQPPPSYGSLPPGAILLQPGQALPPGAVLFQAPPPAGAPPPYGAPPPAYQPPYGGRR